MWNKNKLLLTPNCKTHQRSQRLFETKRPTDCQTHFTIPNDSKTKHSSNEQPNHTTLSCPRPIQHCNQRLRTTRSDLKCKHFFEARKIPRFDWQNTRNDRRKPRNQPVRQTSWSIARRNDTSWWIRPKQWTRTTTIRNRRTNRNWNIRAWRTKNRRTNWLSRTSRAVTYTKRKILSKFWKTRCITKSGIVCWSTSSKKLFTCCNQWRIREHWS